MDRIDVEELLYGKADEERRFTQDFPILPDVWIEYGKDPRATVELLLTPHNESDAPTAGRLVRERLARDPQPRADRVSDDGRTVRRPLILYNESVVLAELTFPQLVRGALPLTAWWQRVVVPLPLTWTVEGLSEVARKLREYKPGTSDFGTDPRLLHKLIRIVSCIESDRMGKPMPKEMRLDAELSEQEIDAFARVFEDLAEPGAAAGVLWAISVNRRATTSIWRSRLTVKADAAERLFQARTAGIRWAILDTGIDARHKAFVKRNPDGSSPPPPKEDEPLNSRVVRTYDFLRLKDLLDPDPDKDLKLEGSAAALLPPEKLEEMREDLARSLLRGRAVDWDLLEPFLRIPHSPASEYRPPRFDSHGTHVAGILAADWREASVETPLKEALIGVCPDIEVYDLRVLPDDPKDKADEFTIIAALQFVRHLNAHKDLMVIHGVNLSLSVPHDVANYACGRTPVCEECERVVAAGIVVVTAAGNRGFEKSEREAGSFGDYRFISITDPGNADSVITVGSTHRMLPHNYGVSYFSSRGPTGDGRRKPDLVAPGERIDSCALGDYYGTMDGTSMAAPHVSGAAALLLARHRELIGRPRRIKEILRRTATDLGRERHFQGAGLVDILRALQSV